MSESIYSQLMVHIFFAYTFWSCHDYGLCLSLGFRLFWTSHLCKDKSKLFLYLKKNYLLYVSWKKVIMIAQNVQNSVSWTICVQFYLIYIQSSLLYSMHYVKSVQIQSNFWSVFYWIRTENSVRMREHTDQKLLRIWTLFTQCCTDSVSNHCTNNEVSH